MTEPSVPKSPYPVPDEKRISEVYSLPVLSHDGKSTQFGELVAPKDGIGTVIVIFSKALHHQCDLAHFETVYLVCKN